MLHHHPFDIITLSETWLRNDTNLLQYVQIPGYSFCYKNRDERREGGVGIYIKETARLWQTRGNYRTYVVEYQAFKQTDSSISNILIKL